MQILLPQPDRACWVTICLPIAIIIPFISSIPLVTAPLIRLSLSVSKTTGMVPTLNSWWLSIVSAGRKWSFPPGANKAYQKRWANSKDRWYYWLFWIFRIIPTRCKRNGFPDISCVQLYTKHNMSYHFTRSWTFSTVWQPLSACQGSLYFKV